MLSLRITTRRTKRWKMPDLWIAALLLASISAVAAPEAADYAREKRWADEITPGIVVGDPLYLAQKNGHKFLGILTETANARMGAVVVHGQGIHPDWGMIRTLRQRLADHGYTTLSIQMPILAADARPEAYTATFAEAVERLQLAVRYLKDKGYPRIALVSHSLGSRMVFAYMKHNPVEVDAWAALGMPSASDGHAPALIYSGLRSPVLDLYGANDLPQVIAGATLRRVSLAGKAASKQVVIAGSDHFYAGHENAMVRAVEGFLDGIR